MAGSKEILSRRAICETPALVRPHRHQGAWSLRRQHISTSTRTSTRTPVHNHPTAPNSAWTSEARRRYTCRPACGLLDGGQSHGRIHGSIKAGKSGSDGIPSGRRDASFMSFFRGIFGANEDGGGSSGSSTTMRREEDRSKMAGEPGSRVSLSQSSSVARAGNATTTPTTAGVAHFQRQKEHVDPAQTDGPRKKPKKSMAELDEELRAKMSGLAGDGGEAGVEYEDGQPVAMKRSVKNNMFRYI